MLSIISSSGSVMVTVSERVHPKASVTVKG